MAEPRVRGDRLIEFVFELVRAMGGDETQGRTFAEALVWSDLIGRPNHGVWRLEAYLKRLERGLIRCPCQIEVVGSADGIRLLDGDAGFGQYVGDVAMRLAVELAGRAGVGAVGVRNSNHFGTGAYFVNLACESRMIGVAMSNSTPRIAPLGGSLPVFGTNPIAFGIPRRDGHHVLVDMASSRMSGAEIMRVAEAGGELPEGIAIERSGEALTDPSRIGEGALLPFGAAKGYGLVLVIEVLSSVLTGSGLSTEVTSMFDDLTSVGNNGHFFLSIDVAKFVEPDRFLDRMEHLVQLVLASRADGTDVRLPGEVRWQKLEEARMLGIPLDEPCREVIKRLAAQKSVPPPW
jgi:LDH2 family malate/lactate/ureidoglycolate dehydrogenase